MENQIIGAGQPFSLQAQGSHFEPSQMMEGGELELRWFCLRVAPKQEHVAIAHLRKVYQVQVFCPRLRF